MSRVRARTIFEYIDHHIAKERMRSYPQVKRRKTTRELSKPDLNNSNG